MSAARAGDQDWCGCGGQSVSPGKNRSVGGQDGAQAPSGRGFGRLQRAGKGDCGRSGGRCAQQAGGGTRYARVLPPHPCTAPPMTATVWASPASMELTFAEVLTATGLTRSVVLPSPSWPRWLRPQAMIEPVEVKASV